MILSAAKAPRKFKSPLCTTHSHETDKATGYFT